MLTPRHSLPIALCCSFWASFALAQERGVDLQLFRPAADSRGLLTRDRSETLGGGEFSLGLWLSFASDPLTADGEDIAERLITSNFQFALGVLDFLEAGVSLPFTLVNGPDVDPLGGSTLAAQGVGDIGFHLKGRILKTRPNRVGLGAVLRAYIPSGDETNFLSSGTLTLAPQLVADTILAGRIKVSVNGGAFLRGQEGVVRDSAGTEILRVGNQLFFGAGASYPILLNRLDVVGEVQALTPLAQPLAGDLQSPAEATLGFKLFLQGNSFLTVGTGIGLNDGFGAPDVRGFAGITFEPFTGDSDGDGYKDNEDKCPNAPEDFDKFQDDDGCPDPDNDGDGILDVDDKCPLVPGLVELQGCPAPVDSDGDGLLDPDDACPNEPEDFDNYDDSDGCPEADNDKDGILDGDDQCPLEAEDKDNFQDKDGCPDIDNDGDTILDVDDQCPDLKGVPEKQGCPKMKVTITQTGATISTEAVHFDYNKATIKKESFELLNNLAELLIDNPQLSLIRVEGHTDSDGSDSYNERLSNDRVKSVVSYLTRKGVPRNRLAFKGYGESCPIADNNTEEGKAKNRRVEFVILEESDDPTGICNAEKTGQMFK